MDIGVIWSTLDNSFNPDVTNGTVISGPSKSTTFTANLDHEGIVIVQGESTEYGIMNTTNHLYIAPPGIDYIQIRDSEGGGGDIVSTRTYSVHEVDMFYAAAYNNSIGYIDDVKVSWSIDEPSVGNVTVSGINAIFIAQNIASDGTCVVQATYTDEIKHSTGLLTVLTPTIDDIRIRDAPNGQGNVLDDPAFNVGDTPSLYAAGYNTTSGSDIFVRDIPDAMWEVNVGIGELSVSGDSVIFTATNSGTGIISVTYKNASGDSGIITISEGKDITPPSRPSRPTLKLQGTDKVLISWSENPERDIQVYVIQRSTSSIGPWTNISVVNKGTTSYTDKNLDSDTTYNYRIIAIDNASNPSEASIVATVSTEAADGFPFIIVLIILIIIIIVIIVFLFNMRKEKDLTEEDVIPEDQPERNQEEDLPSLGDEEKEAIIDDIDDAQDNQFPPPPPPPPQEP
jgi:hypothetical protein